MTGLTPFLGSRRAVFMSCIIFLCAVSPVLSADDVPRMDKDELKAMLDNPDVVILDVRASSDWNRSEYKIRGAHRLDQGNADQVGTMYPKDKIIVAYCS